MAVQIFGLTIGDTGSGYSKPTFSELYAAMGQRWRSLRNLPSMNLAPSSFFGSMLSIAVSVIDAAVQGCVDAVESTKFNSATGISLDKLLSPVTIRLPAIASAAHVYVYGSVGATVPLNAIVRTSPTAVAFAFQGTASVPAPASATAWVFEVENFGDGEQAGVTFTLDVNANIFTFTAGVGDDSRDVRDSLVDQVNAAILSQKAYNGGTLPNADPTRWAGLVREEGGGGAFLVSFTSTGAPSLTSIYTAVGGVATCSQTGAIEAPAESLRYGQQVAGIVGYLNPQSAVIGRDRETDAQLKARHLINQRQGCGNPDAVRSAVLVPVSQGGAGASYCSVEYNSTNATDTFGNKPHSIRVVVDTAADKSTVAAVVWRVKAAGDDTNGAFTVAVLDAEGMVQTINMDELETLYIWADIEITPGENWPNTGDPLAQVREDFVAYVNGLGGNGDVKVNDAPISTFPGGQPRGVANFRVRVGYSTDPLGVAPAIVYLDYWPTPEPSASAASIEITSRQVAATSLVRVTAIYV